MATILLHMAPYAISITIFIGGFSAILDSIETSAKGRHVAAVIRR